MQGRVGNVVFSWATMFLPKILLWEKEKVDIGKQPAASDTARLSVLVRSESMSLLQLLVASWVMLNHSWPHPQLSVPTIEPINKPSSCSNKTWNCKRERENSVLKQSSYKQEWIMGKLKAICGEPPRSELLKRGPWIYPGLGSVTSLHRTKVHRQRVSL